MLGKFLARGIDGGTILSFPEIDPGTGELRHLVLVAAQGYQSEEVAGKVASALLASLWDTGAWSEGAGTMLRRALALVEPVTVQGGLALSAAVCIRQGAGFDTAASGDIDIRLARAKTGQWCIGDRNGDESMREAFFGLSQQDVLVLVTEGILEEIPPQELINSVLSSSPEESAAIVQARFPKESAQSPQLFVVAKLSGTSQVVEDFAMPREKLQRRLPLRVILPGIAALIVLACLAMYLSGVFGNHSATTKPVATPRVVDAGPLTREDQRQSDSPPSTIPLEHGEDTDSTSLLSPSASQETVAPPSKTETRMQDPTPGKPGEHLWKVKIGGSNFSSSPVIGGKKVYVGSKDTNLYCLSVENGEVLWKFPTNGGIGSSPTVMGDKVYFGSYDSTFYCLDRHSGSKTWSQKVGDRIVSSPLADGRMVYCGSNDGKMYAWESASGALKWSFQTAGRVWARPLLIGARLFVGSLDRIFYCLDSRSGELRWSLTTDGAIYTTAAASGNRTVVIGTNFGSLYKIHQETGKTLWKKSLSPIYSSPVVADGRIYLGRKDGRFQCLSTENGEEIWSYTTAADIRSSPHLEGKTIYVGSYDGKMYAFSKNNGKREWEYDTRSKVYATPSVAGGRILFGDMTGWFHALAVKP